MRERKRVVFGSDDCRRFDFRGGRPKDSHSQAKGGFEYNALVPVPNTDRQGRLCAQMGKRKGKESSEK